MAPLLFHHDHHEGPLASVIKADHNEVASVIKSIQSVHQDFFSAQAVRVADSKATAVQTTPAVTVEHQLQTTQAATTTSVAPVTTTAAQINTAAPVVTTSTTQAPTTTPPPTGVNQNGGTGGPGFGGHSSFCQQNTSLPFCQPGFSHSHFFPTASTVTEVATSVITAAPTNGADDLASNPASHPMSSGGIAGMVIGLLGAFGLAVFLVFWLRRRRAPASNAGTYGEWTPNVGVPSRSNSVTSGSAGRKSINYSRAMAEVEMDNPFITQREAKHMFPPLPSPLPPNISPVPPSTRVSISPSSMPEVGHAE